MAVEKNITILVVDDEPPLRKLMQAFLERLGYSVDTCGTATEALKTFRASPERYALVVADLSLPDMAGQDMALLMRKERPAIKVLLCSGYPFELATLPAEHRSSFGSLQKPFLPNMLTAAVEELLGS
jgi:DNA-binding NtrC family response regulator